MKITLRQLMIFAAIADGGSTIAASGRIALSQSATSAALKELEGALGTRLFDRVGTRLVLNDVGRSVLARARDVIDSAALIEGAFGGGGVGQTMLRVGASTTLGNYLLPARVAAYLEREPDAQFEVQIENTAQIASAVARFELDLAFVEGPVHEAELIARPWGQDEMIVVAAPGHPEIREHPQARVGLPALRRVSWLLREPGSGTRDAVEQVLLTHLKQIREGLRFGDTEAIKLAASHGLGWACLSRMAVQDWLDHGRLVQVRTSLPAILRPLWLVHHRARPPSVAAADFLAHCPPPAAGRPQRTSRR